MKEFISIVVKDIVLAVIVGVVIIGALTLFLAVPDILEWLSGYIGGLMTYGLFISGMLIFIAYCVNHAK